MIRAIFTRSARLQAARIALLALIGTAGAAAAQTAADPAHEARYHATPFPDRITLGYTGDPAASIGIRWRTDGSAGPAVAQVLRADDRPPLARDTTDFSVSDEIAKAAEPREEGAHTVRVTWEGITDLYHAAEITGLTPDTEYMYRVGDGERWSAWSQFRTAASGGEPFRFLYFGDAQNDIRSHWSRVVRAAIRTAPDARFMVHAGDLALSSGGDFTWGEWHEALGWIGASIPHIPAVGNSDHFRTGSENPDRRMLFPQWRAQFATPQNGPPGLEDLAYYVDYQGVRVIALYSNFESVRPGRQILLDADTPLTDEMAAAQVEWLDQVLSDNPNRWTVVTFHHPVLTSRDDREDSDTGAAWRPLFERHGVDLVLQAHDHGYARGRDRRHAAAGDGPVYMVSVSGAKMRPLERAAWMDEHREGVQLYGVVSVTQEALEVRMRTPAGTTVDAFRIERRPDGGNRISPIR